MDWFLYDNGLQHERVNYFCRKTLKLMLDWVLNTPLDLSVKFNVSYEQFVIRPKYITLIIHDLSDSLAENSKMYE